MSSKEEIEKKVTYAKSKFWEIKHREPTEGIEILLKIIDELKMEKQKLIEELELEVEADEEDLKYNNLSEYGRGCLDEAKEILEILKGENDER